MVHALQLRRHQRTAQNHQPNIRLYTVPKLKAERPTNNVPATWQVCNPTTTPGFSAVGYYFARDLQKALGVPVGIIHDSWGGSPCEVWIREDVLGSNAEFKRTFSNRGRRKRRKQMPPSPSGKRKRPKPATPAKLLRDSVPVTAGGPSELYNGMIAPIIPYAIKGVIWYQGESNAGRAYQYRKLFPLMVQNWRYDWDQGNFPFLQVQLAPFMAIRDQPTNSTGPNCARRRIMPQKSCLKLAWPSLPMSVKKRISIPERKSRSALALPSRPGTLLMAKR
jgi:sialate O-acetylesterase